MRFAWYVITAKNHKRLTISKSRKLLQKRLHIPQKFHHAREVATKVAQTCMAPTSAAWQSRPCTSRTTSMSSKPRQSLDLEPLGIRLKSDKEWSWCASTDQSWKPSLVVGRRSLRLELCRLLIKLTVQDQRKWWWPFLFLLHFGRFYIDFQE